MDVKVLDASALAALLFNEPEAEMIAQQLTDTRLVAPNLLTYELANVCLVKVRRYPALKTALLEAFQRRERLVVEEVAIDADETLELAMAQGLTVYDASYLWLSQHFGAELVTLDRRLARAAASLA